MYYYIVDTNKLSQRQYERVQNELYSSISEFHISGEVVRVTGVRTVRQLVETAFFHQAKTIVAVGTDETLNEVINVVGDREVTLGFIPTIKTELAEIMGIGNIAQACKNLALRRIAELDLGVANGVNFLTKLTFGLNTKPKKRFDFFGLGIIRQMLRQQSFEVKFSADHKYHAATEVLGGLIINSRNNICEHRLGEPTDGLLDVLLVPKLSRLGLFLNRRKILDGCFESLPKASLVHLENLEITSPAGLPLMAGDSEITTTPAKIEIKSKALKFIVGRERKF